MFSSCLITVKQSKTVKMFRPLEISLHEFHFYQKKCFERRGYKMYLYQNSQLVSGH